ncbi:MAG: hypothetical protein JNN25_14515 [Candidatus Kapabacteria bacterium]|nr:hypothetical protein [Candidatus Kapabacteria bacterium]
MNTFLPVQRACALALALLVSAFCTTAFVQAQEKKEEISDTTKKDSAQRPELRYYVNYGYRGSNPSAVNAELTKAGYSGLPEGAFDFSFGYKRFYQSNWMFGFDLGATFGATNNRQFTTSSFGIYDRLWGGYRFVNTDAVKVYAAAALEANFTFTNITKIQNTSFGAYLANPVETSPALKLRATQIALPLMLNAEVKLPRWFGENYDTWLGVYAGYSLNLYPGLPVLGDGGVRFTDAPNQPAGGFMAGVSFSFNWGEALRKQLEIFGGSGK